MQNLKIGFLLDKYSAGGVETVTRHVANYLKVRNYSVFIFVRILDPQHLRDDQKEGITFVQLPNSDIMGEPSITFVGNKLKELSIDFFVVAAQSGYRFALIKEISPATKLIYSNHGMPLWERIFALRDKKIKVFERDSISKKIRWFLYGKLKYKIKFKKKAIQQNKKVYDLCDAYTVLCSPYQQTFAKYFKRALDTNNKIYVLNNPAMQETAVNLDKKKEVLFIGRFGSEKRVDLLVKIWSTIEDAFPDWKLILVGEGEEEDQVRKTIQKHNVKNIRIDKFTATPKIYYDRASILCLTSQMEGWPMVLIEAQNNGVVPIAFQCSDGVKEILEPSGENGILVPHNNKTAFAKQLSILMKDVDLRKKISENILRKNGKYSIENVGRQWEEMFKNLIKN